MSPFKIEKDVFSYVRLCRSLNCLVQYGHSTGQTLKWYDNYRVATLQNKTKTFILITQCLDLEDNIYRVPTERPRAVVESQPRPSDKIIVYKTVPIILSTKDKG